MQIRVFLIAACILAEAGSAFAEYPPNYDQLALLLSWSDDARQMALGDGVIGVPDGYHNDALVNPSFAALTKGVYFSANTHLELIHNANGPFIGNSEIGSCYSGSTTYDRTQLQKVQLGCSISRRFGIQFGVLRNYVREFVQVVVVGPGPGTSIDTGVVNSKLYALTLSYRPARFCAVGITAKYFTTGSHSGSSFDVGACLVNLLPSSTFHPRLSRESHFYCKIADSNHLGFNAAFSVRDFGPKPHYPILLRPNHDLPTSFRGSLSYLAVKSDEVSLELFVGFSQVYRGPYREDFWDFNWSDRAAAVEVTALNLVRLRISDFLMRGNWSNAWGVSVGPPWCQLEYAEETDLGIFTDNYTAVNDGRRVLSLTVNCPFH